ncbi:MAG: trypsin-like peptidase domain-containing protein [Desulfatitalea sp.]|nr:trypsin-like peptidase domain-containing protein [Desulfatitalea sp.]
MQGWKKQHFEMGGAVPGNRGLPGWFGRVVALVVILAATVAPAAGAVGAEGGIDAQRRSVVRIYAVSQTPDYLVPWAPGRTEEGWGSGFIIAGHRILTNAHVVGNARFITIEKEGDARRYEARVLFAAHDCDLAMLAVLDETFFEGTSALTLGPVPVLDSTVSVLGYPIGGDRLSVTRGVVSRIDYRVYAHSGVDAHLVAQIDAAINPGNSGGPVIQDNAVVGMAFQGFSGMVAQNVGYIIPTPVVERFLQDVSDGRYDRYVDLGIQFFPLINPTQRRALGLAPGDYGVMVGEVLRAGAAFGHLETGDVLLTIDDHPIFSDGRVAMDNDRLLLNEVVERKFKGDTVRLTIMRQGREMAVTYALATPWPYLMQAREYDVRPRFVLFGGVLFQPLSNGFYNALQSRPVLLRYYYSQFLMEELYMTYPEVVVISRVLPDPTTSYLEPFVHAIVEAVNDRPVRTLEDLARAFAQPAEFYVLRLLGDHPPLVIEARAAQAAHQRIRQQYGVTRDAYLLDSIVPPEWMETIQNEK